ncbi:Elongation of very long chain fatty acids protein 7 [Sarcoptes scabiei]|uniref:Elongation of very long chain fatty acids protein n=1 Tax=Sarcoptes scabiei TaxID=52283 RepID=A0A132A9H9_SARSC|nr:Elongation of very long chain fatty acids protein 7 [Sarcoptes scabiei]KPM07651.1 elongation of very long chain fatty acids protein-like protein [Sarcoptes scabiei]UXI15466.1 Stearoyl-CoA desaturase 5 [Sarcoptes scabiei]
MANLQSEQNFNRGIRYFVSQYWQENGDPRTNGLPLIREGPWPTLFMIGLYILFVTRIGPSMMKKREAYQLRIPMLIYNTSMVIINTYFLVESMYWLNFGRELFNFKLPRLSDPKLHTLEAKQFIWSGYLYWLTKFIDLMDTIFFVLRKKYNQISLLHLYHHSMVPILGWLYIWYLYGVPAISLFAFLNSSVHVIMYSYYALAALGPRIQKFLWWKRYITQIQIIQFLILIIYGVIVFTKSDYPSAPFWIAVSQPPIFFGFFANFYVKSYFKQSKKID